jgi:hypothetical protein
LHGRVDALDAIEADPMNALNADASREERSKRSVDVRGGKVTCNWQKTEMQGGSADESDNEDRRCHVRPHVRAKGHHFSRPLFGRSNSGAALR